MAPDAQKALAVSGLTLPKHVLVDPQIFSVRVLDLESGLQQWYQRMYLNMDRNKFDDWLLSLISNNVEIVNGRCTAFETNKVEYIVDGKTFQVRADIIVGADGANSLVRKNFFSCFKTRQYIAIQQWFRASDCDLKPFFSCIFDEKTSDCCSWIIGKDEYILFGGAFNPKGCKQNFELQKQHLEKFGIILGNAVRTESCVVLRPLGPESFQCGNNFGNYQVFLAGEAAGFISPSSLEGISYAITSAVALSDSINTHYSSDKTRAVLRSYQKATLTMRLRLLTKNIKCQFIFRPVLRKMVMKSGIASIRMRIKT